jgi:hypothetical protein
MEAEKKESTTAEQLLFHLQLMGVMMAAGRDEMADNSYIKAQKLAQQLIDEGH